MLKDLDWQRLDKILESGTREELTEFCDKNGLEIKDGKVRAKSSSQLKEAVAFWDKRQLVRKILLNSLYGALLNSGSRFFDARLGQSTTLTGRSIDQHMAAKVNEIIAGEYDYKGDAVIYCVDGSTELHVNDSLETIADLYHRLDLPAKNGIKYLQDLDISTLSMNTQSRTIESKPITAISKQNVIKRMYRVRAEDTHEITVSEDHRFIVKRDEDIVEATVKELTPGDMLIINDDNVKYIPAELQRIEYLGEYLTDVYDITVADNHNFFGNDILTHNCDTDSVDRDSEIKIKLSSGEDAMTIESLFSAGTQFWNSGEKEYSRNAEIQVLHYSGDSTVSYVNYLYVYRHRVSKKRFKITTTNGKSVIVTEDHSVMVLDKHSLVERKPAELTLNDTLITFTAGVSELSNILEVEQLTDYQDEYVYDIGVSAEDPYFFANDILVHNSSYFSAYPILKKEIESGAIKWDKETAIEFYDAVAEEVNQSFPHYMRTRHNSPDSFNHTIAAGREVVGRTGIFITKKRYAILVYDTEGFREDQNGKPGKTKAMGLDLKRSDTPVFMQTFLKEILHDVLTGASQQSVIEKVREFRQEFRKLKPWEMGTPKRVNKLTYYYSKEFKTTKSGKEEYIGKFNMPGHVRAAINYNRLRSMNNDNHSMKIVDGMKTIVCRLKPNSLNISNVAIPIDETRIPDWFKALPFDLEEMEAAILDQKLTNLLGVLNWDMTQSKMSEELASLFDFE